LKVKAESGIFVAMNRNAVRWVLIFGILSIIGILGVQIFFIQSAVRQEDRQLNQSITIALSAVAERLADFNDSELPHENPVFRHSPDYYIVNVNGNIDPDILEQFLISEFKARNLNLDYEYGIYDCHTDEMVYGRLVRLGENARIKPLEYELPKHSAYLYYFGIHFVGRTDTLLNSMGIWYFFSLILIVVVIFFVYTQWIILRQKRYAEVQRDFINTMTHEFKTPLASLSLSADVLLKPDIAGEPARLHRYAGIIRSQVDHLLKQVEQVLEMGGPSGDSIRIKKEDVDLKSLITDLLMHLEPRIQSLGGQVHFTYDAGSDTIRADRQHLTNLLLNILDNSLKYSQSRPLVEIHVKDCVHGMELTLEDSGIGIPKESQKRVFERFYRVPTGNIQSAKGFGLGLYYSKRVVKGHGWKLGLESEPGKGTLIRITIPEEKSKNGKARNIVR
jgi:two-component system phosphate regulon sensor histidine kinase PhoR